MYSKKGRKKGVEEELIWRESKGERQEWKTMKIMYALTNTV